MKKTRVLAIVVVLLLALAMNASAADVKIGGHIKMLLYDSAYGVHGVTYTASGSAKSSYYNGLTFEEAIIYITAELSDFFSIEVDPKFSTSTGATPKFGSNIGANKSAPAVPAMAFEKAIAKVNLPYAIEVSAGMITPVFTLEYGHELFWEEEFNGGMFAINTKLAAWHDAGIEIYRNTEIGDVSLPVYLYIMNGNSGYDKNGQPVGMIHIEPEWGIVKLSGSIAWGKDESNFSNFHKWSAGTQIRWDAFELRGEYARGKFEKSLSGKNALSEGYYVKAFYKPLDWLRLMYHFDVLYNNYSSMFAFVPGSGEKYITNTAGMQVYITKSSILEFQLDVADWRKTTGKERIIFTRPTLGLRVTF